MANQKISQRTTAITLAGTEYVPIIDGSLDLKTTVQDIADMAILNVIKVKVSISSAEILDMNSTPKTILAAQGAGTLIVPLSVVFRKTFVSVAYTTNVDVTFAPNTLFSDTLSSFLSFTETKIQSIVLTGDDLATASAGVNTPINLFAVGANPVAGNGTVDVYFTYAVLTL